MSGHSHFKTIKHEKAISDQKRGKIFSKISQAIALAIKNNGSNPVTNSVLKNLLEEAKKANMPKDTVERAMKKGEGTLGGATLEEVIYEAFGPGGTSLIIEAITDNKNRSLGEVKKILSDHSGKLANEGSVRWGFDKKGIIVIDPEENKLGEELELKVIEAGAEDIVKENDSLSIYTQPEKLNEVKQNLENAGIKISSTFLGWKPKEMVGLEAKDKEAFEKLLEALDENDAVQNVYSNIK